MLLLGHENPFYEAPAAQSSIHSTTHEFTELLRTNLFPQMFVIINCMARCLLLYRGLVETGEFSDVSQYFPPYIQCYLRF